MPIKNAAPTLKDSINSVLNQSYINFELIIIDDHSTDNSLMLVKSFADPRITLIKNLRSGIAAALNSGLMEASGEYIARMDADDIAYPNKLNEQYRFHSSNPEIDVVSCHVQHESMGDTSQEGYKTHVDWINSIITPKDHYDNRYSDAVIAHPTLFCKRQLFIERGQYSEEAIPEDFELWLRWMQEGVKFAKRPQVLYQWRDYPLRASRIDPRYSEDAFNKVKAIYLKKWLDQLAPNKEIWIWGYGKQVIKKVSSLTKLGIHISGFIDVKQRDSTKRNVKTYQSIEGSENRFYLIYVSDRLGKVRIKEFLEEKSLKPSHDYYFMT
jgi:glycosyltransferase involved in cell wall biosynthesis